ncbi:hypothetical protein FQN60_016790, partial [Etheostoma spectabile]
GSPTRRSLTGVQGKKEVLILGDSNINRIPPHSNRMIQLTVIRGPNSNHFIEIIKSTLQLKTLSGITNRLYVHINHTEPPITCQMTNAGPYHKSDKIQHNHQTGRQGSKIVIMDRNQYLTEANRQLSNTEHYRPIQSGIQPQTQAQLRNIIHSLTTRNSSQQNRGIISSDQTNHALDTSTLLPKIHKDHTPGPFPTTDLRPTIPHYDSFNHNPTCLSPNPNQDVYPNPNPKTAPRTNPNPNPNPTPN